jgi:hypothetical protein
VHLAHIPRHWPLLHASYVLLGHTAQCLKEAVQLLALAVQVVHTARQALVSAVHQAHTACVHPPFVAHLIPLYYPTPPPARRVLLAHTWPRLHLASAAQSGSTLAVQQVLLADLVPTAQVARTHMHVEVALQEFAHSALTED